MNFNPLKKNRDDFGGLLENKSKTNIHINYSFSMPIIISFYAQINTEFNF